MAAFPEELRSSLSIILLEKKIAGQRIEAANFKMQELEKIRLNE